MTKVQKNNIVSISNNLLKNIDEGIDKLNLYQPSLSSINTEIKSISSLTKTEDGKSSIKLEYGSALYADTTPAPTKEGTGREGWYYTNPVAGNKMNLYFFDGNSETFTVSDLEYLYSKIYIDSWNANVQNLPFLQVYTKPTGIGDAGAFYHSRITYDLTNGTQKIGVGEEVYFFGGNTELLDEDKWFENRSINADNVVIQGEGLGTEEILFLVLATDSAAQANGVNIGIKEVGFSMGNVKRKITLIGNDPLYEINSKLSGELKTVILGEDHTGNILPIQVSNTGVMTVEVEHTWKTSIVGAYVLPAGIGNAIVTDSIDMGNGQSHEYPRLQFFLTNSAGVSIDIQGQASYDSNTWFTNGMNTSLTSNQINIYFCQSSCLNIGNVRYMRLRIVNNTTTSTNILLVSGVYN